MSSCSFHFQFFTHHSCNDIKSIKGGLIKYVTRLTKYHNFYPHWEFCPQRSSRCPLNLRAARLLRVGNSTPSKKRETEEDGERALVVSRSVTLPSFRDKLWPKTIVSKSSYFVIIQTSKLQFAKFLLFLTEHQLGVD